jgi:hypothetical protein
MSFIDIPDLDNLPELEAVAAGEYQLKIQKAEVKQQDPAKGNSQFLSLSFEILSDNPNVKNVSHVIMLPNNSVDDKENYSRKRRIKAFIEAFKIGMPFEADQLGGETGWALLSLETSDEYGDQNRVKKFVVGK